MLVTIDADMLWEYGPGIGVIIGDDKYLYVGRGGLDLGRIIAYKDGEEILEDDSRYPDGEVVIDTNVDLDGLINYYTKTVLQLIDEGWVSSGGMLDLTEYTSKLIELVRLREILSKEEI